MNKIKGFLKYIISKDYRFLINKRMGLLNHYPDEYVLQRLFYIKLGYPLNLDHPVTLNEKLQWLKIHDHNPLYTSLADKYEVKQFVSKKIGEEYVIPTLGVWDSFDEIDFDSLPKQFVLKCTHDSHGLVICKDKNELDIKAAKMAINKAMKRNYYYVGREWPYKNIKPRIIAEEYIKDNENSDSLTDYKFYTFNGKVKFLMINSDRFAETKADYYDLNFNHLDFTWGYPNSPKTIEKPQNFEEMIELAEILSAGIPHVRVDFYESNHRVLFGELTFFDGSGFSQFDPPIWDEKLGLLLELPQREE